MNVSVSWYAGVKAVLQRRFPKIEELHVTQSDRSALGEINLMSARRGKYTTVFVGPDKNTFVDDASKIILRDLYRCAHT